MKKVRKPALFAVIPLLALLILSARFILPAAAADTEQDLNALSYVVAGGAEKGWKTEYELGDTVAPDIPDGTRLLLKYPDGGVAKDSAAPGQVTLDIAGHWTAVYTKNGRPVTKEFRFLVNAEKYELQLPFDGADIPTLIEAGGMFTLPKASVLYTGKRGEIRTLNDPAITVTVATAYTAPVKFSYTADSAPRKIIAPPGDEIFITYAFGESMKSVIQKDYIVTVTDSVNYNIRPYLNISPMLTDVALMTKVTLPVAWAFDEQDDNVRIEVSVKAPDGSSDVYTVKEDMLDEYMLEANLSAAYIADKFKDPADTDSYYARNSVNNPNKAVFDNKRSMTFYPHLDGVYEITYTATNDIGKTDSKVFKMQCGDMKEPVIKIRSSDIPKQWTNDVLIRLDENDREKTYTAASAPGQLRFYFPKPAFVDNACLEKDIFGKSGNVSVEVFKGVGTGIVALDKLTYRDGAYMSGKAGTEPMIFEDGDRFYIPVNKLEADADYEIAYYVLDNAVPVRRADAIFDLRITSQLKDVLRPDIRFQDAISAIKTGGRFTKPLVSISDNSGAWTQEIRYLLVNSVTNDEADFTAMKDLFYNDTIDKFDLAVLQSIRPGAGFGTGVNQFDKIEIRAHAVDAAGNVSRGSRTVDIIDTVTARPAPVFETIAYGDGITAAINNGYIELRPAGTGGKFEFRSEIVIKAIKIRQAGKDSLLGYEFTVRNEAGDITGYTETISWIDTADPGNTYLYIDVFKFTPDKSGKYTVTLSAFNASNAVRSINFALEIEENPALVAPMSFAASMASATIDISETLEYGRAIELPNFVAMNSNGMPLAPDDPSFQYKRTIKGPHYSLQGFELLALMAGEYKIEISAENSMLQKYKITLEIKDDVGPSIRLTGVMPLILYDKDQDVYLPGMMVSDAAGIDPSYRDESVIITDGDRIEFAKKITREDYPDMIAENPSLEGMYFFKPFDSIAGFYLVTYWAADNNEQTSMIMFIIFVSDRSAETGTLFMSPVNFSVVNGNGSLAASVEDTAILSGAEVTNGKSVVFKASPDSSYRVKEWKLNGIVIAGNTSDTYVLTDFEGGTAVNVEFELIPQEGKKPDEGCDKAKNTAGIIGALFALALGLTVGKKRM